MTNSEYLEFIKLFLNTSMGKQVYKSLPTIDEMFDYVFNHLLFKL